MLLAHNVGLDLPARNLTGDEGFYISHGVTLTSELPPPGVGGAFSAALIGGTTLDQGPGARNPFSLGPRVCECGTAQGV